MFFLRWKVTWPVLTFRSCKSNSGSEDQHTRMTSSPAELRRAHLYVDFVTAEHDRDVLTNTFQITVPVGDVLVRDTGGYVEHDDTTLSLDVVAVTKTAELFLSSSIPDIEAYRAEVRGEGERVHFDTESGCKGRWRDELFRMLLPGFKRDESTDQCTSSRIRPSSDATEEDLISTRSGYVYTQTHLDEGSFTSTAVADCRSSRHIASN